MTLHDLGYLGQGHHAHGTRANYLAGCHCTPCRSANAAYLAAYRRAKANHRLLLGQTVQSYQVRRCLRSLIKAEGFPIYELARRLGLHRSSLWRHAAVVPTDQTTGQLAASPPRMRVRSAAKILAFYRQVMAEEGQSPAHGE